MKNKTITIKDVIDRADVMTKLELDLPVKAAAISAYRKNEDQVDEVLELFEEKGIDAVSKKDGSLNICMDYLNDYVECKEYYEAMLNMQAILTLIGFGAIIGTIGKGVFKVVKILIH